MSRDFFKFQNTNNALFQITSDTASALSSSKNFFKRITLGRNKNGINRAACITSPITLVSVERQRSMTDENRRLVATEQLDSYYGYSTPYLRNMIEDQINTKAIALEMKKLASSLPLLKKFICSISKVYAKNPVRTFYIEDKQIVSRLPEEISDQSRFIVNKKLSTTLESLYNKDVVSSIKEAEKLTNLLNTTIFKVVTDQDGLVKLKFIPNDTLQICQSTIDPSIADEIAFIKDDYSNDRSLLRNTRLLEQWTQDEKITPVEQDGYIDNDSVTSDNLASNEAEKLFGTKTIGSIFAPFVVFRESDPGNTFWNLKDADTFAYIKSINFSLTELRYLIRYTSFGLKYAINAKIPDTGAIDPTGFLSFQSSSRTPGDSENIAVGEFENKGRIKEVIESIIFNLKMLYDSYNLKLDSLISSNSISSAESKDKDDKELFAEINSQRDIWSVNEEQLFKVLQAVHNRDNSDIIPQGVTIRVNYEEQKTQEKLNEDWMVEVENNISSVLDWISAENPDLTRKELQALYENNISINSLATESNENEFEETDSEEDNDGKEEATSTITNNKKLNNANS